MRVHKSKDHDIEGNRMSSGCCKICWYRWHNEYRKAKRLARGLRSNSLKTHCPQGHEYTEENIGHKTNKTGRTCKACNRARMIRLQRSRGVQPAKRLTREEKLSQRRKWENDRRSRLLANFVESIDPVQVYDRDNGICQICSMTIEDKWEIDHIIPLARGGEHSYKNIQLSHPSCNRKKWALMPKLESVK